MATYHDKQEFTSSTKMSDLIIKNYSLLLVITRFGIHLGFGEKTVGEVCEDNNVDTATVLYALNAVANMPELPPAKGLYDVSISALVDFLSRSHSYFLDFKLPNLRSQLLASISNCPEAVAFAIRQFFDEYAGEVHKHMSYEDKTVFPYARKIAKGELNEKYRIDIFSKRHDQIEAKISELKNILIKYYPTDSGYELNSVLHDIFATEKDLATHNFIEDHVFVPRMRQLEAALAINIKV